jgi:CubicO group peptidase (beta-lactamase class C family)
LWRVNELAVPADVGVEVAALERVRARAVQQVDDGILPSCQYALARHERLVAFETIGDATNDTRYVIFSCTKGPVSSAVWILLGEQAIGLGQRVADLVPGFGANGKQDITIEQCLRHTAGFPSGFMNPHYWNDPDKRLEVFASWQLEWEPGSRYAYHQVSAQWILAEVIERATSRDYRAFLTERVFEPLGLGKLRIGVPADEQGDIAFPVVVGEPATPDELEAAWGIRSLPGWLPQSALLVLADPAIVEVGVPAGGAVGTAADLAMFYQAVLRSELWEPDVIAAATSAAAPFPDEVGRPTYRGLGLQINGPEGSPHFGFGKTCSPGAFGHDGAGSMIAWADPATGLSFSCLTDGLDENAVRQKRRMASFGTRAAACVSM